MEVIPAEHRHDNTVGVELTAYDILHGIATGVHHLENILTARQIDVRSEKRTSYSSEKRYILVVLTYTVNKLVKVQRHTRTDYKYALHVAHSGNLPADFCAVLLIIITASQVLQNVYFSIVKKTATERHRMLATFYAKHGATHTSDGGFWQYFTDKLADALSNLGGQLSANHVDEYRMGILIHRAVGYIGQECLGSAP